MEISLNEIKLKSNFKDVELSGVYTKETLISKMSSEWIPLMECHKCGKSDYCKYAEKHDINPDKKAEIQCGVAKDFIENFIDKTFDSIEELDDYGKQSYLNSAYYLSQYVQSSEGSIGTLINKDFIDYYGNLAPSLYGFTAITLDYLNKAHEEMKNVEIFNSKRSIILVEGKTEQTFVNVFSDIHVLNYEGKDRLDYSKIEFIVRKYKKEGYDVFLQADLDGGTIEESHIKFIISKKLIEERNIFSFKHDFETAVPLSVIHKILLENEIINDEYINFSKVISRKKGNISKQITDYYNIEFSKPFIAYEIAKEIDNLSRRKNLYYDANFLQTEIGEFWYFISTCKHWKSEDKFTLRSIDSNHIMLNDKVYKILSIPYGKRVVLKSRDNTLKSICFEIKTEMEIFLKEHYSSMFI